MKSVDKNAILQRWILPIQIERKWKEKTVNVLFLFFNY